jgi:hypothetical protein
MEEARESITQTVTEIKDTVANQYQAVRDTVTEALDWREQFRKRPVAFSVGALSAGFILGYTVAGTFKGDGSAYEEDDYPSYEESDAFSTTGAAPASLAASSYGDERSRVKKEVNYSAPSRGAQAVASGSYGSTQYAPSPVREQASESNETTEAEPDKPGLIERFKETRAYDKLQEEVSSLGDRFIEELSSVGRNVVLPALFLKVRDLFGVDLSNKQGGQAASAASGTSSSSGRGQSGGGSTGTGAANASAGATNAVGGSSSYATSENRAYQTPSPDRT